MPLDEILKLKVPKETAIPTGKYEVVMAWSPHYQCDMPHLVNVPGYSGVMIHWGNSDVDTEGCLLMGEYKVGDNDWINNSHNTFNVFLDMIQRALDREEKTYITIC